jgi:hypothetical protein
MIIAFFSIVTVVGEYGKTCHPRNVEVHEIREICFQGQRNREDLESGTHEVSESRMRGGLESRTLEASESRKRDGLEPWTCEASKSRIRRDSKPKTQSHEPVELRTSRICEVREYDRG